MVNGLKPPSPSGSSPSTGFLEPTLRRRSAVRSRSRSDVSAASVRSNQSTLLSTPPSTGGDRDSYGSDNDSVKSRSSSSLPSPLHDAFKHGLGKAADHLRKVAREAAPHDVSGTAQTSRVPFPTLESLLSRHVNSKTSLESVRAMTAHVAAYDERLNINEPEFKALKQDLRALTPQEQRQLHKMSSRLRDDLVGLKLRQVVNLDAPGGTAPPLRQRFGHMEQDVNGRFHLIADQTLSSDGIKHDMARGNGFMRQYNANLGAVHQNGALLLVRSARTDSAKKIEELLLFGAAASPPRAEPYKGVIISAMDLSVLKDVATRVHGENETDLLAAQQSAVKDLFGDKPSIERTLANGRQVTLARPLLMNTVLSAQARDPANLEAARAYNSEAFNRLSDELAQAWTHDAGASPAARGIAESLQSAGTPAARVALLSRDSMAKLAQQLPKTDQLALAALKRGLTGTDFEGRSYDKAADPGKELTMLSHLLTRVGRTPHVQCKSGEDRTLTMVSLLSTVAMFGHAKGEPYDPHAVDANPSNKAFARLLFTRAADAFGEDPIKDVRGAGGKAKWGFAGDGVAKHPVPGEMYLAGDSKIGQPGR